MRPVYLFWTSDVTKEGARVVCQTLRKASGVLPIPEFPIRVFGNWFQGKGPHQSLRWYEEKAWRPDRGQLDGDTLLFNFENGPWQKEERHLDFAVFGKDMTATQEGKWLNFVFGLSREESNVVISTYRFDSELKSRLLRRFCIQRAVFHEFCHALGLLPDWRTTNVTYRYGKHCTNLCVMREAESVPEWLDYAQEEIEQKVTLCHQCEDDLRRLHPRVKVLSTRRYNRQKGLQ